MSTKPFKKVKISMSLPNILIFLSTKFANMPRKSMPIPIWYASYARWPRWETGPLNLIFFAECDKKAKNPYVGYAFVPGMAQIKKGSVTKGALFITGEVVCISGIVVSECLRSSYVSKANSTRDVNLRKNYTDYANNAAISRNVFIAATAAVYVWNVIDGIVAKGQPQLVYNSMEMRFAPYLDVVNQAGGLALNMRF